MHDPEFNIADIDFDISPAHNTSLLSNSPLCSPPVVSVDLGADFEGKAVGCPVRVQSGGFE